MEELSGVEYFQLLFPITFQRIQEDLQLPGGFEVELLLAHSTMAETLILSLGDVARFLGCDLFVRRNSPTGLLFCLFQPKFAAGTLANTTYGIQDKEMRRALERQSEEEAAARKTR